MEASDVIGRTTPPRPGLRARVPGWTRFRADRGLALALVVLTAVTVTGTARRVERASHPSPPRSADERSYLTLAGQIAHRGSYGSFGSRMRDPLHWPPGAPFAFAVTERATGAHGLAPGSVYMLQALLGSVAILAAFAAAALVAGRWAGVAAAAATSFYPPLVEGSGHALSEPLGALELVLAVAALAWAVRRPSAPRWALAGALLGLTLLTRADLGPVVPVLAVWALLLGRRAGGWRQGLAWPGALVAAAAVVLAPWAVYASHRAHALVPISTGGSSGLFAGTFLPGHGSMFGLKHVFGDELRLQDPHLAHVPDRRLPQERILDLVAARHPRMSPERALTREAARNLRRYALGRPWPFAKMLAAKAARMWTTPTRGPYRKLRADRLVVHLVLVVLALLGALAGWLRGGRRTAIVAVLLVAGTSTVVNAVYLSEPRHLLPLAPSLFAAGAAGWALLARRRRVAGEPPAPGAERSAGQPA